MLLDAGRRVRAMVHRIDARSEALAAQGAEVVQADFLDLQAVSAAAAGASAAYFCYPILTGGLLQATAIFAQAASEAGIRAVVNMSQMSARREAKSHAAQHHWIGERMLDRSAFMTTHLRPTLFSEWLTWSWRRLDHSAVLRLPFGDGRHAPISGQDQAAVIAAILQNPAPHDRQIYPLYGSEELDHYTIAERMADAVGIPVRYEPVAISTFTDALAAVGLEQSFVQHISNIAVDYQQGVFAGENNLVEVITGKKPMTVGDYVVVNRSAFEHSGVLALPDPG